MRSDTTTKSLKTERENQANYCDLQVNVIIRTEHYSLSPTAIATASSTQLT